MKFFLAMALSATAFMLSAQKAEAIRNGQTLILRSGGAEYLLNTNANCKITGIKYHGKPFWYANQNTVLNPPCGWIIESDSRWNEQAGKNSYQIEKTDHAVHVRAVSEGRSLRLVKKLTLRDQNPALESEITLEISGSLFAEWGYFSLFNIPFDKHEWFHLGPEIRDGKITARLFHYPESPFYDWQTNTPKKIGNETPNWNTFALVGQYDRQLDLGMIFHLPEQKNGEITFFCGGGKNTFLSLRYPGIGPGKEKWIQKQARFVMTPFQGSPEQAAAPILTDTYISWLESVDLMPFRQDTATAHSSRLPEIRIWSETALCKIFREEAAPEAHSDVIRLNGAKNEGIAFQIALKAGKHGIKNISIAADSLKNTGGAVISQKHIRWNPLGYVLNNRIIKGTQLTGEIPDVLLEQTPIACPPEKTQPFLLRINIPPEAEPGIYTGNLRILADDIPVADIPVRLNVWNFTLPEQPTLLSVLNPWPHRITAIYPDNAELRAKAYRQVRELTIDAHGVWLCRRKPEIEWDKDGNIVKFDTTAFDRELEEYFRQTRAKLAINSFARFGVGGAPFKQGYFGTLEEINTPIWEKRVASFAKAFHAHLAKKDLLDKFILDVFDEPQKQWIPYLKKNLENVRKNAPGLMMTSPGHYHAELDGLIDHWQLLLYPEPAMVSPELKRHFESIHSAMAVYNPSNFEENSMNSAMRGFYWWMWRMGVSGWMQWCTTLWAKADENPGWNAFNNASWIAYGPHGLRSTMRMEMCRLGSNDYEYLTLLSDVHAEAQRRGKTKIEAEAAELMRQAEKLTETNGNLLPAVQNAKELHTIRARIGNFLDRQAQQEKNVMTRFPQESAPRQKGGAAYRHDNIVQ